MNIAPLANSPLCSPLCPLPIALCNEPPFFTYLEIPFLMIVVRMPIHTCPWLVIDCPPLTPYLPLPSQRLPQFMLHVFRDYITTSVTLSDTGTASIAPKPAEFNFMSDTGLHYWCFHQYPVSKYFNDRLHVRVCVLVRVHVHVNIHFHVHVHVQLPMSALTCIFMQHEHEHLQEQEWTWTWTYLTENFFYRIPECSVIVIRDL